MSSINAVKTKMMHKDIIKYVHYEKVRYGYPEHANVKMTLRKRQTFFNPFGDDHTFSA